ncbi:Coiled-coil domain-containing protein 58 [Clydaea vesicula]|uniref:Coiled-coil domain-containing protein 58 n=1 Tax=Clydaea vesicula TaxID=447962 RepID=A0AAD5TZ95_9FUNG|nr:Coiled-coil domain-containing protein 58 [Clydaea vesicula]KAJ3381012.1 Coiled-coil domain-containing protein 58 [Lobulomyces angularis]
MQNDLNNTVFNLGICEDLSNFFGTLGGLRKLDDNIIPKLNALTTRSTDLANSCSVYKLMLQENYTKREQLLKGCIEYTKNELEKENAVNNDESKNKTLTKIEVLERNKNIELIQKKLDKMESEFRVEDIIRDRALEIFKKRCRNSIKIEKNFGELK